MIRLPFIIWRHKRPAVQHKIFKPDSLPASTSGPEGPCIYLLERADAHACAYLRAAKELSQIKLGKLASIHYNQIGRYEQGISQPSAENASKLAGILEVSSDYLLHGDPENAARANFEDREILKLFQEVEKLPENDKVIIKRVVSSILNQRKLEEMTVK